VDVIVEVLLRLAVRSVITIPERGRKGAMTLADLFVLRAALRA